MIMRVILLPSCARTTNYYTQIVQNFAKRMADLANA
jgi:hypothetical protein